MTEITLSDYHAVTFDVYGTLIDWEPEIALSLEGIAATKLTGMDTSVLLAMFDEARGELQKVRPAYLYPEILRRSFDRICEKLELTPDSTARETFARGPGIWQPFPDASEALSKIRTRAATAAVSNIDNASLTLSIEMLKTTFDVVVTAEIADSYKPSLKHFELMLAKLSALGIPANRVLHVGQSLRADMIPAASLGLATAWIDRPGRILGVTKEERRLVKPNLIFSSMSEFASAFVDCCDLNEKTRSAFTIRPSLPCS